MAKKKNAAAVELGKKGGKARAKSMTADEKSAHARKAVGARWDKYYAAHPEMERPKKKARAGK